MGKLGEWVKEHPYATGGIVLAIGLLFLLRSGSGGGATQTVAQGPSDNVVIAGIQAGAQAQQLQAQLQAHTLDTQAAETAANHQIDTQLLATVVNDKTQLDAATLQAGIQQAGIAAQEGINATNVGGQVSLAQIAAGANRDTLTAQTEQARLITGAQTQQAHDALAAQVSVAGFSRDVSLAGITANSADYLANVDAAKTVQLGGFAAQEVLAKFASDTQLGLAKIGSDTTLGLSADDVKKTLGIGADQLAAITAEITAQQSISHDTINAGFELGQHGLNLIGQGVLNKGGEGGTNQTQAFGSIFGVALPGAPQSNTLAQIGALIAGIGKGVGSAFGTP